MVALDFFCGAGGLTRGLLDAGIDVRAGIDIDDRLRETYTNNNAPSRFIKCDIEDVNIHDLRTQVGITDEDLIVYAACSPCQPFSTLNRQAKGDERRHLLLPFAEIVEAVPPDFVIVENVPGLNTAYGREIYELFTTVLSDVGFVDRYEACLDAYDFGVPQRRRRWIMMASRIGAISPPQPVPEAERTTVRDAIADLPEIGRGNVPNHEARRLMPHHVTLLQAIPHDGGSRAQVEDLDLLLPCHRRHPKAHKDVFGRLAWDKPAQTLTGRCTDVYCGRFAHPVQDRGITLREAAALQTFSDNYVFHGNFIQSAHQIGNAVPVRFAQHIGNALWRSVPDEPTVGMHGQLNT